MAISIGVPDEYLQALKLADLIIYSVKNAMPYGSGNQKEYNQPRKIGNPDGKSKKSEYPAIHLSWEADQLYENNAVTGGKRNPEGHLELLRQAYLGNLIGAGNCGPMGSLAYALCREYYGPEWTISFVKASSMDHNFVLVYKNGGERITVRVKNQLLTVRGVIVVDPWPVHSQALLWCTHFCFRARPPRTPWKNVGFVTLREKPAKGLQPPSDTAINRMAELIGQLASRYDISDELEPEHALTSTRIEKYGLKRQIFAKQRRSTLNDIDSEQLDLQENLSLQYNQRFASAGGKLYRHVPFVPLPPPQVVNVPVPDNPKKRNRERFEDF